MHIGLQVNRFDWPGGEAAIAPSLDRIARAVDEYGFYSLWVMDHFLQLEPALGTAEDPMLESYSTLSYLAARTERVKLGAMVTGVIYRPPALLIKAVTNLDVLSKGRAYFGVGAAWYARETKALGFPFPPISERFERLEETLQIVHQAWSRDTSPYRGKHFQMEELVINPQPISQPHPPILVGGMGEKKTLRLVAQYADACNLFFRAGSDILRHKIDVLHQHCEDVGRPIEEIELTTLATINLAPGEMSASDVLDLCGDIAEMGFHHVIFNMPHPEQIQPLETLGRVVIPEVEEF
jgi:F420-dependent oxidoreductase-like protein